MASQASICTCCGTGTKSVRREFSEQAWTMLVAWGEVDTTSANQPFCETCYWELREVLIDRADEIEQAYGSVVQAPETKKTTKLAG